MFGLGQLLPVRRPLRDGRSTPMNGRAGDAAGTEQMCHKLTYPVLSVAYMAS
jgi:hypothetical protein